MTFCDNLLKSFSEKSQTINKKSMIFYYFLRFHENRRIFHGFHGRYKLCMQNYPSKCIFIGFP